MAQGLLVERKNSVVTVTLNRPEKGNTVDDATMDEMITALKQVAAQQDTRIVLLRGAGEDFCRGREGHSTAATRPTAMQIRDNLRKITTVNDLLSSLAEITIAVVQGRALGFGAGLATRADLSIAADNARFGFPEIKGGLPPAVVMSYLSRWIPRKKATEMVLTGMEIDAAEAERLGMINRVVPASKLEAEVEAWVSLLLKADQAALRACKQFLFDSQQMGPAEAATYGIHLLATYLSSRPS
ncbi:MAG: enoyl-CoA hydratase/isomerase family protein [Acidobacteria bacterium]|nr:enoyl-CoA hydratase/isomerase family protein [Acidobacteriota bacterium]